MGRHLRRVRLAGSPISVTYLGQGQIAAPNTSQGTFNIASFTNAPPRALEDRYILGVINKAGDNVDVLGVQLGGINCPIYANTRVANASLCLFGTILRARDLPGTIANAGPGLPITLRCSANWFTGASYGLWSITGLASPFPQDVQSSSTTIDTVRTVNLRTLIGGVTIAAASNNISASQTCTWSGDDTPVERYEAGVFSLYTGGSDVISNTESASNAVTATYGVVSTTSIILSAASFR